MSGILSLILSKKSLMEQHRQKFSKYYQRQLLFLSVKISKDVNRISQLSSCCTFLGGNYKSKEARIQEQEFKLNEPFCVAFRSMRISERQSYYLELLQMIEALVKEFQNIIAQMRIEKMKQNDVKTLRWRLKAFLEDRFIDGDGGKQMTEGSFTIRADIDEVLSDKIVQVDQCCLNLIQRVNKNETKVIIDVRNYLLINNISNAKFPFILQSVFEGVAPKCIKFDFIAISGTDKLEKRDQLVGYLSEIVKVGKIQRLVDNFDIQMIIFDGKMPLDDSPKKILPTELFKSMNESSSDEDIASNSSFKSKQRSLSPRISTRRLNKRLSIVNRYSQMKAKLIEVLNVLTEKKLAKNQMMNKFKQKEAAICNKQGSRQLEEATRSTEARIVQNRPLSLQYSQRTNVGNERDMQIGENMVLRIFGQTNKIEQKLEQQQSFITDGEIRYTEAHKTKFFSRQFSKTFSYPDIYSKMYPQHKLSVCNILIEFQQVEINDKIWSLPKRKVTKSKLVKNAEADLIKQNVRVYQHKKESNRFKIVIDLIVECSSLMEAITKLELWSKWHPNVGDVKILQNNQEENSYDMVLSCRDESKSFDSYLKVHLCHVKNKYFMVMKSIENPNNKYQKKSFFSFLGFGQNLTERNYDYLVVTLQSYGKKNRSEIVVDLELSKSELKKNSGIKKQQLTLFINLWFITTYWKIKEEAQLNTNDGQNGGIKFNPNWMVNSTSLYSFQ